MFLNGKDFEILQDEYWESFCSKISKLDEKKRKKAVDRIDQEIESCLEILRDIKQGKKTLTKEKLSVSSKMWQLLDGSMFFWILNDQTVGFEVSLLEIFKIMYVKMESKQYLKGVNTTINYLKKKQAMIKKMSF